MRFARRRFRAIPILGLCALLAGCASTVSAGRAAPQQVAPSGAHHGQRIGSAVQLLAATARAPVRPGAAESVARAEQAFTVALLKQLRPAGGGNLTVSPASLAIALTMLENGGRGATQSEIAQALDQGSMPLAEQNAGWQALVQAWGAAAADGGLSLASANSAWLQQGLPVRAQFLDALRRYYASGVWQVDFTRHPADALTAIDHWCAKNTNGKITKLFDQLDPATLLVLADAVYFKAEWRTPFVSKLTQNAAFTTADGRSVQVPMMQSSELTASAAVTPEYSAVQLPYRGDRFAALAVMPTNESLASFVASLSPAALSGIASSLTPGPVDVTMPRFTTRSTLNSLPDVLNALGMRTAFTPSADFGALSPVPLQVDQVVQRDYLSVTEKGTEAAAVTGISMVASASVVRSVVHLDHPFLFLIRDVTTGAVLFASEVSDPTAG